MSVRWQLAISFGHAKYGDDSNKYILLPLPAFIVLLYQANVLWNMLANHIDFKNQNQFKYIMLIEQKIIKSCKYIYVCLQYIKLYLNNIYTMFHYDIAAYEKLNSSLFYYFEFTSCDFFLFVWRCKVARNVYENKSNSSSFEFSL